MVLTLQRYRRGNHRKSTAVKQSVELQDATTRKATVEVLGEIAVMRIDGKTVDGEYGHYWQGSVMHPVVREKGTRRWVHMSLLL